jgi:hypothetical protein
MFRDLLLQEVALTVMLAFVGRIGQIWRCSWIYQSMYAGRRAAAGSGGASPSRFAQFLRRLGSNPPALAIQPDESLEHARHRVQRAIMFLFLVWIGGFVLVVVLGTLAFPGS